MSTTHDRAISIPIQSSSLAAGPSRRTRYQTRHDRNDSSDAGQLSSVSSSWASSSANNAGRPAASTKAQPKADIPNHASSDYNYQNAQDNSKRKGKQPETPPPNRMSGSFAHIHNSPLGPSMASSSSYKSINLSAGHGHDPNDPPRLICYTKYSQGFTWNDELFLPSYMLGRYGSSSYNRRRRQRLGEADDDDDDDDDMDGMMDSNDHDRCPVAEIFVTDEEAEAMMP